MGYGISTTLDSTVSEALDDVRRALSDQGFGVLTEIDMAATLRAKLGVEIPAQVILGACNPPSAYRALGVEESIGLLLPCNVVVRAGSDGRTIVETVDPQMMVEVTKNDELRPVADDVANRLRSALAALSQ